MDWNEVTPELTKKLDPKHVKGRKQGGGQVQYIEGWHAIAEMNAIFGFGAWDRETVELRQLGEPREVDGKMRVDYMARVRITVWGGAEGRTIRDGCGFGQGIDKDVGQAHESALKEAETDAMKRAMMTFGNRFGLALYDKARENVGVNVDDSAVQEAVDCFAKADTLDAANAIWRDLPADLKADARVIDAAKAAKARNKPQAAA